VTQTGKEGGRFPMTMRHTSHQTLPPHCPATSAGHFGIGTSLIKKDQRLWFQTFLHHAPDGAVFYNIFAFLLGGVRGLFPLCTVEIS